MREYDLAFSLGFSCGCTQSLRAAGLQFASYPFDWVGSPGLIKSVRMLVSDFAGWLEADDLELWDVRRAPLFSRVYRNARTGFGFPHDFPSALSFEEAYVSCKARYDRRIARLLATLASSRRVLAVYVERMIDRRVSDAELVEARRLLAERFPQAAVDLLYFFQEDGCESPCRETPANGIETVALDYKLYEAGKVIHEINRDRITDCLRAHARVRDGRSAEDRVRHDGRRRNQRELRWGSVWFGRRLFNEFAYKLYRRFERRLVNAGVLPREEALWF